MQLAFAMPHLMEVTAITTGWERAVTGAEQQALAKFADDLGFAMIAVPEHFVIPTEHKDLSGDFYFSAYPGMAFYAADPDPRTMRMSFVTVPEPKLREGVRILGEVIAEG